MRGKILSICFILTTVLMLCYIVKPNEKAAVTPQSAVSEVRSEKSYVLKEYKGKLAVFKENSDIPLEVFDIFTSALPESDRELLKNGITAKSDSELKKLIADYTS